MLQKSLRFLDVHSWRAFISSRFFCFLEYQDISKGEETVVVVW